MKEITLVWIVVFMIGSFIQSSILKEEAITGPLIHTC